MEIYQTGLTPPTHVGPRALLPIRHGAGQIHIVRNRPVLQTIEVIRVLSINDEHETPEAHSSHAQAYSLYFLQFARRIQRKLLR